MNLKYLIKDVFSTYREIKEKNQKRGGPIEKWVTAQKFADRDEQLLK